MRKKDNSKPEFQSVGDAIRDLLNSYRISSKFDEMNLISSWEKLVGKPIASRTKRIFIRNTVLFVEFDSASMRHDFSLHKAEVIDLFKKEFGPKTITDIIVM